MYKKLIVNIFGELILSFIVLTILIAAVIHQQWWLVVISFVTELVAVAHLGVAQTRVELLRETNKILEDQLDHYHVV